jgi:hypothetical protein
MVTFLKSGPHLSPRGDDTPLLSVNSSIINNIRSSERAEQIDQKLRL